MTNNTKRAKFSIISVHISTNKNNLLIYLDKIQKTYQTLVNKWFRLMRIQYKKLIKANNKHDQPVRKVYNHINIYLFKMNLQINYSALS